MRIVFMGTPLFAVPSLAALLDSAHEVVGVFCQPDRPQGRGNKLTACPVKQLAESRAVPVYQFQKLRAPEGVAALMALKSDYVVTAAFGQILSQALLDIPAHGTVNVHASLLPNYRGPAPINWCLINGETMTGVTTMMTDAGIDTGDTLLFDAVPILPDECAGALTERLSHVGAALLMRTLDKLEKGVCPRAPQDHALASRHPMLTKELGRIDWSRSAKQIVDLIRGTDPWPGAHTAMDGGVLKVIWARALAQDTDAAPGTVLTGDAKHGLTIATGQGVLAVEQLQAPGGKRMPAADYLRGHPMTPGMRLGEEQA